MDFLRSLTGNYIINIGFLSWFAAQFIKTLLAYLPSRKVSWERMVGSGGMPSSHSSLVCSVAVGMAHKTGFTSPEFALAVVLAGIVMYDAMGVRRAAGEQAKVLNRMAVDFREVFQMLREELDALTRGESDRPAEQPKTLKEFIGHTPLEVLCGAVLGIVIALVVPVF